MTNKNILQIISGALILLSCFSSWYILGFSTYKPVEFMFYPAAPFLLKLFFVYPLLGIGKMYLGYLKKYNYRLNIACVIVSIILMWNVSALIKGDNNDAIQLYNGFYLAGLGMLISAASIFVMKKEVKTQKFGREL
jgi:hypothetical protein